MEGAFAIMTTQELMREIAPLDVAERIELIGNIWDTVVDSPGEIPMTQEQCDELDRRIAEHEKNPQEGIRWQDLKAILRSRR